MPELESQLRALASRLDTDVAPVRADDITVAEMSTPSHARHHGAGRAVGALVALAAVIVGVVVVANRTNDGAPTATTHTPLTSPARTVQPSFTDQLARCAKRSGIPITTEEQAGVRIE